MAQSEARLIVTLTRTRKLPKTYRCRCTTFNALPRNQPETNAQSCIRYITAFHVFVHLLTHTPHPSRYDRTYICMMSYHAWTQLLSLTTVILLLLLMMPTLARHKFARDHKPGTCRAVPILNPPQIVRKPLDILVQQYGIRTCLYGTETLWIRNVIYLAREGARCTAGSRRGKPGTTPRRCK